MVFSQLNGRKKAFSLSQKLWLDQVKHFWRIYKLTILFLQDQFGVFPCDVNVSVAEEYLDRFPSLPVDRAGSQQWPHYCPGLQADWYQDSWGCPLNLEICRHLINATKINAFYLIYMYLLCSTVQLHFSSLPIIFFQFFVLVLPNNQCMTTFII